MTFKTATKNTLVESKTENGMKTNVSSLNACVDLFFKIGALRGQNVTSIFERAYQEDPITAMKIMLWARDVRGGAGERQIYRDLLKHLASTHPQEVDNLKKILTVTPEIGRWDDLLVFTQDKPKEIAFNIIESALKNGDQLCGKWMPRKSTKKNNVAAELRKHLGWSPKQYRKTLVGLTNVVESDMCAKKFDDINFSHVPSVASARYQTAFHRNAPVVYQAYKDALVKNDGTAKANAGAVYPYDVIKSLNLGDPSNIAVSLAQWEALENFLGDEAILPMVDVSGSMTCPVTGNNNLTCMDVALSLGLYIADKTTGPFKDMFLTFSNATQIEVLGGNLVSKLKQMRSSNWGMNTNLVKAFDEILRVGTENNVSENDMPKFMLILSDMEFDASQSDDSFGLHRGIDGVHTEYNDSAIEMIEKKYKQSGYDVPKIVFWNLNARNTNNVPVRFDKNGTALISGFSPAILKSVLKGESFTPRDIMLEAINVPRYNIF